MYGGRTATIDATLHEGFESGLESDSMNDDSKKHPTPAERRPDLVRPEDFKSLYANNLQFAVTVFDLKMLFGEVDRYPDGTPYIRQHTAVTMAWQEAKIAAILLAVNVAAQEESNGPIAIHPNVLPNAMVADESTLPLDEIFKRIIKRAGEATKSDNTA